MVFLAFKPNQEIKDYSNITGSISQPNFKASYYEYLKKNSTQVHVGAGGSGGSSVVYSVPQGYTFFLTGSTITSVATIPDVVTLEENIFYVTSSGQILGEHAYLGLAQSQSSNYIYNPPLEFQSGTSFTLQSTANVLIMIVIAGFIVKNSLLSTANF